MVAEELGRPTTGWKIAAIKDEMQKALRTDSPIYGRVFEPMVMASPLSVVHAKLCSPIPEAEYMARLGNNLPPRPEPYSVEEVTEAVGSLHPGLELAECRFIHDAAFPALPAILADGAGASTIVYGPPIDDWRSRGIAGQQVVLLCNGKPRRTGSAASAIDNPMVPLTWLANELSRTNIGLQAGQMISTGTLTGMLAPMGAIGAHDGGVAAKDGQFTREAYRPCCQGARVRSASPDRAKRRCGPSARGPGRRAP